MRVFSTSPLYLTRFLAALLVLFYHYSIPSMRTALPGIKHFGEPVNFFFFLSGFVLVFSNQKFFKESSTQIKFPKRKFWLRRFARIYPMYFLALFILILYHFLIKRIDSSIPYRVWLEIIGIQRWIYDGSINSPDWSVSCEFFFYMLFPFALPWLIKTSFKKLVITTTGLFLLNILFTIAFRKLIPALLIHHHHSTVYKYALHSIYLHPVFKFTIFIFGCLCGRFYLESPVMKLFQKYSVTILLCSALLIVFFYAYDIVSIIFYEAGIMCFLYFPLLLSLCSSKNNLLKVLSWKPFIFLGEISYGIYIMQAPVERFFEYLFTGNKRFTTIFQFSTYVLFLILVCSILYYIYEIPLKKIILKRFTKSVVS